MELKMPTAMLHRWVRVGWVQARKVEQFGSQWAIPDEAPAFERLGKLCDCRRGWGETKTPTELTTPDPVNR
jgi:hypothetical protein